LVVVQQRIVRIVLRAEALDVAAPQLEVALEVREQDREVLARARLEPGLIAERAGADDLRVQLDRNAPRLLVVVPHHADQARLVRVVVVLGLELPGLLEQLGELVGDPPLMGEALQGRLLLGAGVCAARRHPRLLVPGEKAGRLFDVPDLAREGAELLVAPVHREEDTGAGSLVTLCRRLKRVNSRPPVRPLGRRTRTIAISAPTTTRRVPAGRSSVPKGREAPFSATARNESSALTASAPKTAPSRLVTQPTTSIASVTKVRSR